MGFLDVYKAYLTFYYQLHGLKEFEVDVDPQTVMRCWAPKSPRQGSRTPLLILHGFGAGATVQFDKQLGAFSKHFDLYIPDLILFGASTTSGPERSEAFQARCALQLMRHFGVEEFDLMGYSYGGSVAYKLAVTSPPAVRRLVLMASGIVSTKADMQQSMEKMGVRGMADMQPRDVEGVRRMLRLAYHKPPWVPSFILREVLKGMFSEESSGRSQELAGEFRAKMDGHSPEEIPRVTQDTLLIFGEFDPLMSLEVAQRLKDHIGANAKLVVIEQTAHMPQAEQPKEVNRAVIDFLVGPQR